MGSKELSAVAYKKGNWMRYTLWGLAAICIAVLISTFLNMMNGEISAAVPENYNFAVTDNYAEGSKIRTTYYVYNDKIFVVNESFTSDVVDRSVMIYDGVNASSLKYDETDTTEICELGTCYTRPKVLAVIKNLISHKIGREYLGF